MQDLIMPLRVFANADLQTNDVQREEKKAEACGMLGPFRALVSAQKMFHGLLGRETAFQQQAMFDDFTTALAKCSVGFIKDAPEFGLSTSVSVGCAASIFNRMEQQTDIKTNLDDGIGLVFNFGTGGGKVSGFSNKGGSLRMLFDIKPRGQAPSPNACAIGNYKPTFCEPKDKEMDRDHMVALIKDTNDTIKALPAGTTVLWVSIVVTGPIREQICGNNDTETDEALCDYMFEIRDAWGACVMNSHGDRWPRSYALPQADEALFEGQACAAIYDSLSQSKVINPCSVAGTNTTCGIGNGSCQAFLGLVSNIGMKSLEREFDPNWMRNAILEHFNKTDPSQLAADFASFVACVDTILAAGKTPIIALKSGFALSFTKSELVQIIQKACEHASNMLAREAKKRKQRDATIVENTIREVVHVATEKSLATLPFDFIVNVHV